jgi:RHS repeat-associated protein
MNWTGSTDQNGNASGYTVYYYGVKGERLGVYNFTVGYWAGGTTPTLENSTTSTETFFGARRLAPLDRLGSARSVNSTASSYYPFGEDKSTNPAIDAWKFGSYWRDSASGLDYADQRYYSSPLGRFTTPDSSATSAHSSSPKSWNEYTYTLSDPFNSNDPSGLDTEVCPQGTGDSFIICYTIPDGVTAEVPDNSDVMNTESVTVTATPDPVDPYQASDPGISIGQQGFGPGSNTSVSGLPTQGTSLFTLPGMNYCGPSGAGSPTNRVDEACAMHDLCYQMAGVSFWNNIGWPTSASQKQGIIACDTKLCNTLGSLSWPTTSEAGGATIVSTFFSCSGGYSLRP